MKYKSRDLTFTIEELNAREQRIFESKFLAMQDLTEEQKNDENYLREVHAGNTLEEVKSKIDNTKGFYE